MCGSISSRIDPNGKKAIGSITNSYNAGLVTGGELACVGGVCGFGSAGNDQLGDPIIGLISNCYNTGSVEGEDGASIGGVCGMNEDNEITDCFYLTGTATSGIGDDTNSGTGTVAPKMAKELAEAMRAMEEWTPEDVDGYQNPWAVEYVSYTDGTLTLPTFTNSTHQPTVKLKVVDEEVVESVIDFVSEVVKESSTNYEVAKDLSFEENTIIEPNSKIGETTTTIYVRNKTVDLKEISDVIALSRPAAPTGITASTTAEGNVQLTVEKGVEYSNDAANWNTSSTFDEVKNDQELTFYARYEASQKDCRFASQHAEIKVTLHSIIIESFGNGTVSSDKKVAIAGETVALTVTPKDDNELVSLVVNVGTVLGTDNTRTFIMPDEKVIVTATFEKKTYTVTVSCDNDQGTVTGGGTYQHGETATLTATAKSGYHFTQWSSGQTANPLEIIVAEDISLTASFEKDQVPEPEPEPEPEPDPDPIYYYNVTIPESITGAIIHGGGTHQVREGSYIDFSIEIDPAGTGEYPTVTVDGYWRNPLRPDTRGNYRVYVYDDDCDIRIGEVSGYGTYTLTLPADSLFEGDDLYRSGVGIAVTPASSSPSSDALRYPFGTELTLTAVSDRHRAFVEWMDGSRRSPLTFRLREDTEAYAWFRVLHPVGNEEIAVAGIRIRTERGGSIVIDTPKRLPIAIYALSGQCLRRSKSEGTTRFSGLSEGSYLVVVGRHSEVVIVR